MARTNLLERDESAALVHSVDLADDIGLSASPSADDVIVTLRLLALGALVALRVFGGPPGAQPIDLLLAPLVVAFVVDVERRRRRRVDP